MRRTCNPEKPVRTWHRALSGTPAFRTSVSCGQVNRCHAGLISHASGVQLASPQPILWRSRSTEGPLACNQQMSVQLPPLPPNSPGRPLRSRRRSETPDKHVRLVLLAPTVTVAEWLRRTTVDRSTRVRFSPVTPFSWEVVSRTRVGGSSPSPVARFSRGRRSTDQDTRLRTGRHGGSNPPARTISARRPKDRAQLSEG
jgi:hypothetical protein